MSNDSTSTNPAMQYMSTTQEVETDAGRVKFITANEAIKLAEYERKVQHRKGAWSRLGIVRMSEGNE